MASVERAGAAVDFDVAGERGPFVLFAHNLLCDRRVFDAQAERLRDRFRVVRVDLRGHGASRGVRRAFAITDLADDLVAVLDAVGADRAHLVGLSMGASASMQLALRAPERVRSLVTLGATCWGADARDRAQNALLAVAIRAVGMRGPIIERITPALFGSTFRRECPGEVARWGARVGALAASDAVHAVQAWTTRPVLAHELPAITAPTLVVAGEEDTACPVAHAEAIRAAIPGASLRCLPRAGHTMTVERPSETADLIDRFVSEH